MRAASGTKANHGMELSVYIQYIQLFRSIIITPFSDAGEQRPLIRRSFHTSLRRATDYYTQWSRCCGLADPPVASASSTKWASPERSISFTLTNDSAIRCYIILWRLIYVIDWCVYKRHWISSTDHGQQDALQPHNEINKYCIEPELLCGTCAHSS